MIGIDIIRKKRDTGGSGSSFKDASGLVATSGGDAQNAAHADTADRANRADEATHAVSAKELDGDSSVWNTIRTRISDANSKTLAEIAKKYLRKDVDDTVSGLITFLKGLAVGGAKKYGIDPEGVATLLKVIADSGVIGSLTNTTLTSEDASIKNLTVTGAAHFFRLIIDEIKASGGSVLVTPANGFKVAKVVKDGAPVINNNWKVETYNFYKADAQAKITKDDFTGKEPDGKYYITDETFSKDNNVPVGRENFSYKASTYALFSDETTADVYITTDDGGALYINGVLVQQFVSDQSTKTTLHFSKGINTVVFCLNEFTGDNYTHMSPCLTKIPGCEGLSTSIGDIILYYKAEDGERAVTNKWKVGMQAVSMSFNAATGETLGASNHYWWRLVTGVSAEPVTPDWDKEHKYHWITVSGTDAADGSEDPQINDEVAQLGYRVQGDSDPELRTYTDTDGTEHKYCPLQSAIYLSAYDSLDSGLVAPFLAFYRGISDFDLKSHRKTYFDARANMLVGDVYNIAGMVDDVIISKPVIGYEIKCKVSGVSASQVNYDTIKASSSPVIEFDFFRNGEPYVAKKATVGCYDGEGALLGSLLEVTDSESSSTVMDGGNLYLSASTKRIVCTLYDAGGTAVKELGVEVVRDGGKGDKGDAACFIRVYSSAGTVYKNHKVSTVLTARVFRGSEDVTDRCTGSFTWYKTENGVGLGLKSDGSNVYSVTGPESYDEVKYMCIYDGDISEKAYGLTYGGKSVTFGGKSVVRYGE